VSKKLLHSLNGDVKKEKRQRAVITITERDDGKFDASLTFEPSIKQQIRLPSGQKIVQVIPERSDNIAVQAAWHCWRNLKEQSKTHIVLTDE
jgi:hypothetical protein